MNPLVLVPQHFGSLVFDRRSSRYFPFDHEVTNLLRDLCRPKAGGEAKSLFRLPDRRLAQLLDQALGPKGFFSVDGFFAGDVLEVTPPKDHLLGPLAVHLEIVASCNLACAHCFAAPLPRKGKLSGEELDLLFAELAGLGSFRLGITGGEPLVREDLFEVLDSALGYGLRPCVATNGLTIDKEIARAFGDRPAVRLNVSLDGATAETHDRVRGAGTFLRTIERLQILRRHTDFALSFTLTRETVGEVEACARLAREVGASTAVFRPLYPVGSARSHPELMPTYEGYVNALERLERCLESDAAVRGIDPFSPQLRAVDQAKIVVGQGCGAATVVASISAEGSVSPCSFLGPKMEAGNLRTTGFAKIWNDSAGFKSLRALGATQPSGRTGRFTGGCRARAQTLSGHFDDVDPWYIDHLARGARHPCTNLEIQV